jgi:hypothetical protein
MLLLDGGQWAIINEWRGSEDVLIKIGDFSSPKIVPTRDVGNLLPTVGRCVVSI